eukprot:3122394-Karenia_brevis.AAC.1
MATPPCMLPLLLLAPDPISSPLGACQSIEGGSDDGPQLLKLARLTGGCSSPSPDSPCASGPYCGVDGK